MTIAKWNLTIEAYIFLVFPLQKAHTSTLLPITLQGLNHRPRRPVERLVQYCGSGWNVGLILSDLLVGLTLLQKAVWGRGVD